MSNPLFSVVIPLYNKADVVRRTLDSVRTQTFRDFEVVVVDDGSKDNSGGVVNEYIDEFSLQKIVRIITKANGGVSSARNEGIKVSNGRYIAFLDADDFWLPDHLSALFEVVDKHPQARAIASGYYWDNNGDRFEFCRGRHPYIADLFRHSAFTLPVHTSAFCAERDTLLSIGGFKEGCSFFEDYLLFFQLAVHMPFYFTGRVTEVYTSDAKERLTSALILDERFPHYEYVANIIRCGNATEDIDFYAHMRALDGITQSIRCGNVESAHQFVVKYPEMVNVSKTAQFLVRVMDAGRGGMFLIQVFSILVAVYFRIRRCEIMRRAC